MKQYFVCILLSNYSLVHTQNNVDYTDYRLRGVFRPEHIMLHNREELKHNQMINSIINWCQLFITLINAHSWNRNLWRWNHLQISTLLIHALMFIWYSSHSICVRYIGNNSAVGIAEKNNRWKFEHNVFMP